MGFIQRTQQNRQFPAANMSRPTHIQIFRRALHRLCPQCGDAPLFRRFYTLHPACHQCGHEFDSTEGSTWFFMYASSGAVIGICFLILHFWRPTAAELPWASALMIAAALAVLIGTLPLRKSAAIALDYLIESNSARE